MAAKKPAKKPAAKAAKPKKPAKKVARAKEVEVAPPPVVRFKPHIGCKVLASARRDAGFAEIKSVSADRVKLRFYTDVVNFAEAEAPLDQIAHPALPAQTLLLVGLEVTAGAVLIVTALLQLLLHPLALVIATLKVNEPPPATPTLTDWLLVVPLMVALPVTDQM